MAMFRQPTTRLKEALALVRGNQAAVDAIDAEEREKQKSTHAESKRLSGARVKRDAAMPARVKALDDDFATLRQLAIHRANEKTAEAQLSAENGLTPASAVAFYGIPSRSTFDDVMREFSALASSTPLPFAKGHASAAAWKSAQVSKAAAQVDDVAARVAEREQMLREQQQRKQAAEANRQKANADRVGLLHVRSAPAPQGDRDEGPLHRSRQQFLELGQRMRARPSRAHAGHHACADLHGAGS